MRFVLFLLPFLISTIFAAPVQQPHVEAELVSEVSSIQPGQPFWTALRLKMEDGWHTYYKNPGDSGLATSVEWDLPEGFTAGEIQWPKPETIEIPPLTDYGYHGEVFLLTKITPPKNLEEGQIINLKAKADWLVCEEICLPGSADLSLELPVKNAPPEWSSWKPQFDETRSNLDTVVTSETKPQTPITKSEQKTFWFYMLFAFLGGIILNLMPCVFPVLSIKILNFVQQSGEDKKTLRLHGWLFAAGVLVSFWVLAGLLLILRAGGQELGWGFQLQSPQFVYFITLLLFVISLNLLGVFEFGTSLIAVGGKIKSKGWSESFLSGVLATIVATPCTAPFMGIALAFALTQPPFMSLIVFTALGAGLAFPYVLLSHAPQLLRWLPKPGAWMETFKQAMAFPMLAAVIWLAWVLGKQTGSGGIIVFLFAALLASMGAWIFGKWGAPHLKFSTRGRAWASIIFLFAILIFLSSFLKPIEAGTTGGGKEFGLSWETYSPEKIETLRKEGKPVFIDFTAAWCATCQVNKFAAFTSQEVRGKFKELGVVTVKADWTNKDPVITKALESYGRSGVPVYVLYGKNSSAEPTILPEVLTPQIVLDALRKKIEEKP